MVYPGYNDIQTIMKSKIRTTKRYIEYKTIERTNK